MKGTVSIVKMTNGDDFRVIFYGTEMPEGMDPSASYVAKGMHGLSGFLAAIGVHSDKQQAIRDALRMESSTNILEYSVPDDVLMHFGLL